MRFRLSLLLLISAALSAEEFVLDLGTSTSGAPLASLNHHATVAKVELGAGIQVEPTENRNTLTLSGWADANQPVKKTLRGDNYLGFVCRLGAGVKQVTGIEVYGKRNVRSGPTRLVILGKAGSVKNMNKATSYIRGELNLRSPDIDLGKRSITNFSPLPTSGEHGTIGLRLYPKGQLDENATMSITIDYIVIHTSDKPLNKAVKHPNLDSILSPYVHAKNTKSGSKKKQSAKKTAPPSQTSTVTLNLAREDIDGKFEPTAEVTGNGEILSTMLGMGTSYAKAQISKLKENGHYESAAKIIAYGQWKRLNNADNSTLTDAIAAQAFFEYTIQFGPTVRSVDEVLLHVMTRGENRPDHLSLITDSGTLAMPTAANANGQAIQVPASLSKGPIKIEGFEGIELDASKEVTFRFYAWNHPPSNSSKTGTIQIDKIEFQVSE